MWRLLETFAEQLELKGVRRRTAQSYCGYARRFGIFIKIPLDQARTEHLRDFLLHLSRDRGLSDSSLNCACAAICSFARLVLNQPWTSRDVSFQHRARRRKLPVVLSKKQVVEWIDATTNLRDRTLMMTAYSAGLRIEELRLLKTSDIDSTQMRILIQDGKGGKQRYVMLAETLLATLREYWAAYRPPAPWLFASSTGKPLHSRTIQRAFEKAKKKAGIRSRATPHTLRHCFATHLLDSGAPLPFIKELLGHRSIKTTMIYLKVSDRVTTQISSPLDSIRWP